VSAGILESVRIGLRRSIFLTKGDRLTLLTLNRQKIPFVGSVEYFDVVFDRGMAWGMHIERVEAGAFGTFTGLYFLLESER
jgi:hypothetical protein